MAVRFVVDNSVVMAWCFEDETDEYAEAVLNILTALYQGCRIDQGRRSMPGSTVYPVNISTLRTQHSTLRLS